MTPDAPRLDLITAAALLALLVVAWVLAKPFLLVRSSALNTPDEPAHDSGCALHNEPYLPAGPCDCSVSSVKPVSLMGKIRRLFA